MSQQSIKFQYQTGIVVGGYSFSAYNNIITLCGYVEKLENAKIREAIQFEAITARSFYIDEVNRLKANGEKVNSFIVKREATRKAKDKAQTMYAEIWSEVEDTYKTPPPLSVWNNHRQHKKLQTEHNPFKRRGIFCSSSRVREPF